MLKIQRREPNRKRETDWLDTICVTWSAQADNTIEQLDPARLCEWRMMDESGILLASLWSKRDNNNWS